MIGVVIAVVALVLSLGNADAASFGGARSFSVPRATFSAPRVYSAPRVSVPSVPKPSTPTVSKPLPNARPVQTAPDFSRKATESPSYHTQSTTSSGWWWLPAWLAITADHDDKDKR